MNAYYLKKFRNQAKKHVKVQMQQWENGDLKIVIGNDDYTREWQINLVRKVPCWLLRLFLPNGKIVVQHMHYGIVNGCRAFEENIREPQDIQFLSRETQIECLKDARRLYVRKLLLMEEFYRDRRKQRIKEKQVKKAFLKTYRELKRL